MYDLLSESAPATQAIPPTDGERLMRFVRHRDEDAFAEVVEAHATLVWSVCWQILKQRQDAEDAFQATFLILARKAHTIKANDSAAAWLYRVAFRTALRLKERRRREASLVEQQLSEESLAANEQLDAVAASEQTSALMEELHALPARYQRPLILHYFEAKSRSAIAEELGCSTSAIKGRLGRARGMRRSRLARRGVALSAAMAVTASAFEASAATLPVALPTGTAGLALAFRTKSPLPDGAQVVGSLAQKGIAAMTIATMMKPAACILAVSLAAVLLTTVSAEENASSLGGKTASVAVDLAAADDPKSIPKETREIDKPFEPSRNRRFVEIDEEGRPIPADSPSAVELDTFGKSIVEKPESPIVAPTQTPTKYFDPPSKVADPALVYPSQPIYTEPPTTQMGIGAAIAPMPVGGKEQLELELKYWELKADSLEQSAKAKTTQMELVSLAEGSEKRKHLQEQADEKVAYAESLMSKAESYLALSKKAELEGRLKQIERMDKLEKQLRQNPPQSAQPPATSLKREERRAVIENDPPRNANGWSPPTRKAELEKKLSPNAWLMINASGVFPNAPINGRYQIESMGTVSLGKSYGRVKVIGLTLREAELAIEERLSQLVDHPNVRISAF